MMAPLHIAATGKTPFVNLDPSGRFRISGRSIEENPSRFFEPLLAWIRSWLIRFPGMKVVFDIDLEYFNSMSTRYILEILRLLIKEAGKANLTVNWHFEIGDDDLLERGQYYESILNLKFNFVEYHET